MGRVFNDGGTSLIQRIGISRSASRPMDRLERIGLATQITSLLIVTLPARETRHWRAEVCTTSVVNRTKADSGDVAVRPYGTSTTAPFPWRERKGIILARPAHEGRVSSLNRGAQYILRCA